jgi:hypothetical protein
MTTEDASTTAQHISGIEVLPGHRYLVSLVGRFHTIEEFRHLKEMIESWYPEADFHFVAIDPDGPMHVYYLGEGDLVFAPEDVTVALDESNRVMAYVVRNQSDRTVPAPDPSEAVSGDLSPAEAIAREFHETYERLAPTVGYQTRKRSAVPWGEVPHDNKTLMVKVAQELLDRGVLK